jgi:predicted alpha/beta hydrolase family esterase
MSMATTLVIPGLHSSGPSHWQTWFEAQIPGSVRVIQHDWKRADLPEWAGRIRHEITRHPGDIFLVAHSFGALAGAQAAADYRERIRGALLVAPADPEKFGVTDQLPAKPLGFPAAVIASTNDPWISISRASKLAAAWGAEFVNIGPAGHINVEAGYGAWPEGLAIFNRLTANSDSDQRLPQRARPSRHWSTASVQEGANLRQ